jgi:ribosome-associated translation inhibitor RaiA
MQANTQGGNFKLDKFELFNQFGVSLKKIATNRVSIVTATKIFVTGKVTQLYKKLKQENTQVQVNLDALDCNMETRLEFHSNFTSPIADTY